MVLSDEERKRRASICVKRWIEQNHERWVQYRREYARLPHVTEAKRNKRREQTAKLIELGLLERLTPGRPRLYATPEESKEAKRKQMLECHRSSRERLAQAVAALRELESAGDGVLSAAT